MTSGSYFACLRASYDNSNQHIHLLSLDSPYTLSDGQSAFTRNIATSSCLPFVSGEELAVYRPLINDAADRFNTETRPLEKRDTYAKRFCKS